MPIDAPVSDLDVIAAPTLPASVRSDLEQAARRTGLSLDRLELLAHDLLTALRFVESVHAGTHETFLDEVDWDRLEACWSAWHALRTEPRVLAGQD